jgi:protein kinase
VLAALSLHLNIVQLHEVILCDAGELYLVFEYAQQGSLQDQIEKLQIEAGTIDPATASKPLIPDLRIRSILRQALRGLQHIHNHGYFHRDIKPANILIFGDVCKVADFSLARPLVEHYPKLTTYISTRWYRAPEIILRSSDYGPPVDVFALAAVAGELYHPLGYPLFGGASEIDQLSRYIGVLGEPSRELWPKGVELMELLDCSVQSIKGDSGGLPAILPTFLTPEALDWFDRTLALNPDRRLTTTEALAHEFLSQHQPTVLVNSPCSVMRSMPNKLPEVILSFPTPTTIESKTTAFSTPPTTESKTTVLRNPYRRKSKTYSA